MCSVFFFLMLPRSPSSTLFPYTTLFRSDLPTCEKPSFMQNMMQQISGNADVTTSKDGILITKHGEGTDLIDRAIANNGTLPENVQAVIHRTPPAKSVAPAPQNTEPAEATGEKKKIGIS